MNRIYEFTFIKIIDDNTFKYSEEEKIDIMKECLSNGVDINYNNGKALMMAIFESKFKVVKFLIDSGIDYRRDNDKFLLISCASKSSGRNEIIIRTRGRSMCSK